ncbi:MAG: response regulator, partial [Gemmatimonadetes bacterium]|nr:response regulator [Gemmatimonadota bacterium]
LIILDLMMPELSGTDVLKMMSENTMLPDIPVIVFTASTNPEHARLAEEYGVRRFLQKPADFGDLVAAIKEELPGDHVWEDSGSESSLATGRVAPRRESI